MKAAMRANFITPYVILEIGADPGDLIILEPTHPRVPILVISNPTGPIIGFDRRWLPLILDHIENFSLVSLVAEDPHMTPSQIRRWITAIALKSPSHVWASIGVYAVVLKRNGDVRAFTVVAEGEGEGGGGLRGDGGH